MKKPKPLDLGFDGIPPTWAEWAWRHEIDRELTGGHDLPASVHYELAESQGLTPPIFAPIVRGAEMGRAIPGCKQVVLSIAPGASRQQVAAVVEEWLATNVLPVSAQEAVAERRDIDYVARLRDLAALRCRRANLTGPAAASAIHRALSAVAGGKTREYMRELPRHLARCAARAEKHIAGQRRLNVAELLAAGEAGERDEAVLRTWLRDAEAIGDTATVVQIRVLLGK